MDNVLGKQLSRPFLIRNTQWFFLAGLLILLYRHVLPKWGIDLFNDPNYSHGLLIPFVSVYYIKTRLTSLQQAHVQPNYLGILVLFAGLLLFVLGFVGGELFTKRMSFIIVLYGLISFLEGKEVARILRFPVGILFFSIPLPYILYNSVAFPLKLIATKIAVWQLSLLGMPVFREGNIVYLTHTTLEVVDACSGIRSLMTLFTLAFFLGFLMHKSLSKRGFILALALPLAVMANACRVALTGILTKYDPAWGEGFWHEFSGWLVFIFSFGLLAGVSILLKSKKDGKQYVPHRK